MTAYVLVTAARNEAAFIEKTLQSVVAQKKRPLKWVIVSDGSTDQTEAIVEQHAGQHGFIQLSRRTGDQVRNFGSKVRAFASGYEQLKALPFEFVGNLDADVSMDPAYYEGVLSRFAQNERLGIAGGTRYDLCNGQFRKIHAARNSVGGPYQLFRRACYEEIGGYRPFKLGGIDAVAEIMARMHGWEVMSFPELRVYHYRCTGTAGGNIFKGNVRRGMQNYVIGYHPVFQIASCVFQLFNYPVLIGSLAVLSGYVWAACKGYDKVVAEDVIRYLRSEQLTRLRSFFSTGRTS
jgi:glycosyltransferase involved in cell wall biosynthesis